MAGNLRPSARQRVGLDSTPPRHTLLGQLSPEISDSSATLSRDTDLWISPSEVRQRIGAWAYDRTSVNTFSSSSAKAASKSVSRYAGVRRRPTPVDVRRALAAASAVAEVAHATWRDPGATPLWAVEIPADEAQLAVLSGLTKQDATAAIDLLLHVGVIERAGGQDGLDGTRLRLVRETLEALPGLTLISWDAARERIEVAGGSIPSALAVLRELARATGPVPDPERVPHIRYSVRDLETDTQFGRSTVSEALGVLERAGLVSLDSRRGQTMRYALTPAAFGIRVVERDNVATVQAVVPEPNTASASAFPPTSVPAPVTVVPAANVDASDDGHVSGSPKMVAASALIGEFAGTPIYAPPGTPLVVERDTNGAWTCRIGPFLRLGPVPEKH